MTIPLPGHTSRRLRKTVGLRTESPHAAKPSGLARFLAAIIIFWLVWALLCASLGSAKLAGGAERCRTRSGSCNRHSAASCRAVEG